MSEPQDDILKRLQAELTQQLWDRLLLHADDLIRAHIWHGVLGGAPLHGNCAEDYVNTAVLKTLNASRIWQPDKCTLEMHLKGAIRSQISHASSRVENQRVVRESSLADEQDADAECPLDAFPGESLSPEEAEMLKEYEQTILEFVDQLSDDKAVQQLFEAIYDGIVKRSEQAKALQIPETQVDVIKKRLVTRQRKFSESKTYQN